MGNADLCIDPKEVPDLKSKALAGDGKAAWKLSLDYGFCGESISDGEYWAHIAGQNEPKFHASFASELNTYPDINDKLRAIFWLNIDVPGRSVALLLTPAQSTLTEYNRTDGRYAGPEWNNSPDVGIGVIKDVRSYNEQHSINSPISESSITPTTMWPLRVDALLGNQYAADALANHYYLQNMYSVFFYWKTIAAENGDPASELFLAETYGVSGLDDDRARAAFWAARAVHDATTPELQRLSKYTQSRIQSLRNLTPGNQAIPPG